MSPVERIQAAIEKLERLREERGYSEMNGWLVEDDPGDTPRERLNSALESGVSPITNDALIVTLNRTLDAQIAILYEALVFAANSAATMLPDSALKYYYGNALALADAILGEDA